MKNKLFLIVLLSVSALLLLCACQTSPIVWDSNYPSEKSAIVAFYNMEIDSYNGIGVKKFSWVKIPAGKATFSGEVTITHGRINFIAKNMEFTCVFEEGKEYFVRGSSENMQWGVSLYETKSAAVAVYGSEKKVSFNSFKNQPIFQ